MDVYASGAACYASGTSCNGPYDYSDIFGWVFDQPSYALGPNGNPFVSTFSSGGFVNTEWLDWKKSIGRDIYFCPDFDETDGYYNGTAALPGWWYYWGPVVDCIFSWETSWPKRSTPMPDPNPNIGAAFPGDVTMDEMVQAGALANEADYMMGLSSLQYKNSYGANVFRQGGLTLPARMANIFGMSAGPDYIEIQTWNDGPEGHNIGNVWPEENSDLQPSFYMKDHTAWQPLIASFIEAWKAGGSVGSMRVPSYLSSSNNIGVGALWYQALPMNAKCPYDDGIVNGSTTFSFWEKPFGFDAGDDLVYWAFVLEPAFVGGSLEIYSGSVLFEVVMLDTAGLSYASFARSPGPQAILLKDPSGNVLMGASGGECVYGDEECLRYIYDMNFSV
ncbi:glycoside hydrolase family 71 protein, partial [Oidiodendron maius Zn]